MCAYIWTAVSFFNLLKCFQDKCNLFYTQTPLRYKSYSQIFTVYNFATPCSNLYPVNLIIYTWCGYGSAVFQCLCMWFVYTFQVSFQHNKCFPKLIYVVHENIDNYWFYWMDRMCYEILCMRWLSTTSIDVCAT